MDAVPLNSCPPGHIVLRSQLTARNACCAGNQATHKKPGKEAKASERELERLAVDTEEEEEDDDPADPDYGSTTAAASAAPSKRKAEPLRDGKLGVTIHKQIKQERQEIDSDAETGDTSLSPPSYKVPRLSSSPIKSPLKSPKYEGLKSPKVNRPEFFPSDSSGSDASPSKNSIASPLRDSSKIPQSPTGSFSSQSHSPSKVSAHSKSPSQSPINKSPAHSPVKLSYISPNKSTSPASHHASSPLSSPKLPKTSLTPTFSPSDPPASPRPPSVPLASPRTPSSPHQIHSPPTQDVKEGKEACPKEHHEEGVYDDDVEEEVEEEVLVAPDPSYWYQRNPLADEIFITDVTANLITVTIRECKTKDGFFKTAPQQAERPGTDATASSDATSDSSLEVAASQQPVESAAVTLTASHETG
ncbi:CBX family C-terminal motif [Trinorchestia longiramus]|nr:CBX family C-terminal motif [Trinorchestia longiramus]